ncbi:hypothetical protein TNIN_251411 [Trichonephila inaurata madagascariensis]|uniref:Uncharacterized protein n=1 Tax=Trichonephila inaurata madagascariensis TaxID=2747483 RepID=A0A8X6II27_9ARAC|nr:hypothetical protein TNIN_251411 [Trichonephila inaurata madagascariensis]
MQGLLVLENTAEVEYKKAREEHGPIISTKAFDLTSNHDCKGAGTLSTRGIADGLGAPNPSRNRRSPREKIFTPSPKIDGRARRGTTWANSLDSELP